MSEREVSRAPARRLVVIGNFDGVHLGHAAVLAWAEGRAQELGLRPTVLTFDPHPAVVLGRPAPALLTRLARKLELLGELGVEVVVRPFDAAFSALEPRAFAEQVLVRELGAAHVIVGHNFRFGRGRSGDIAELRGLGQELGFEVSSHDIVGDAHGTFSSTRVRSALANGDVDDATRVLGRPHRLTGVVVAGDQRGRTLGFPTANLGSVLEGLPRLGVYAVRATSPGLAARLGGVANIGARPTVGGTEPRVEVHLFEFEGDLYGSELGVELVAFLRAEQKFSGLSELRAQIASDAARARSLVDSTPESTPQAPPHA